MKREQFASRLGFLLMTAGCAIGLGNVWRFPYIVGKYGGAIFVLVYLCFLALLGFPVMVAELSLGRASQSDLPGAYRQLGPSGNRYWPAIGHVAFLGNFCLLMFYSVVTGWMLYYFWRYLASPIPAAADTAELFGSFLLDWKSMLAADALGLLVTGVVCSMGVRKGIEKAMKVMLGGLFVLELLLVFLVQKFPGAGDGIRFFLAPDLSKLTGDTLWPAVHAAMMQAFFTLSLGIGSIAICGSYIGKDHSLSCESTLIIALDTVAAILAGLIIFPACAAFKVDTGQGPSIIFISLTKIFQNMGDSGRWIGLLFFAFMSVAALSTLIAVAENIIAYLMRTCSLGRVKASIITCVLLFLLSLPCLFGFNLLSGFTPFGAGSCVLDLEDFIVSDNLLPLGAVAILLFCGHRIGWGYQNFLAEANAGMGAKFPRWMNFYFRYILPAIIFALWLHNIIKKFC